MTKDISNSSLTKKLLETAATIDERRSFVIEKYGVSSQENFHMVELQDCVGAMLSLSNYAIKNGENFFSITHNAKPQKFLLCNEGEKLLLPITRLDIVPIGCACEIYSARIKTADIESKTYTGEVLWADKIEGCSSTSNFVAHPIPEEIDSMGQKELYVRDKRRNFLTGGHHLTAQLSVNKDIGKYVKELIG